MSLSIAFEPLRGHIIVNVMCVDDIILVQLYGSIVNQSPDLHKLFDEFSRAPPFANLSPRKSLLSVPSSLSDQSALPSILLRFAASRKVHLSVS
ncbi:unnamed protein product [Citrullus colocynthis]|uniref:Uncharacterized protein n=1 Tax=Citrullus colocynthis TaxID=252529 RepID=A0ABP0Y1D6_9ROSI